jgi:tetratricopeptide (TPR) repeat protein
MSSASICEINGAVGRCVTAAVLLALLVGVSSCSESGDDPIKPPTGTVSQGWSAFENGDLVEAESQFRSAASADPSNAEAFNGLGWALVRQLRLPDAQKAFDDAIGKGLSTTEPLAGRAIVRRDVDPPDYAGAIADAEAALAIDANFVFAHDTNLNSQDLLLLIAQSHFGLGQYVSANDIVIQLGGAGADPQSATFVDDLLAQLARLSEQLTP